MAEAVPALALLDFVRAALALLAFLFLPGWLFISTWNEKKPKLWTLGKTEKDEKEEKTGAGRLRMGLPEIIAAGVFASIAFMSLIGIALAFTIGVSVYSVLACELLLIGGLSYWKLKK